MTLAPTDVDIWLIDIADASHDLQQYRCLLSPDEMQRADRFCFARDRRRFTVTRGAVREILGRYTGVAPQSLRFSYGARGKPALSRVDARSAIEFNLSHSADYALLAVTTAAKIGVDIEQVKPETATRGLAEHFFAATEACALRALPDPLRADAFFDCWTRKEAYIKARGDGFAFPLDSFIVAFAPGAPAALVDVRGDAAEAGRWTMYSLEAPPGYKAALVVEGRGHCLCRRAWKSRAGDADGVSGKSTFEQRDRRRSDSL